MSAPKDPKCRLVRRHLDVKPFSLGEYFHPLEQPGFPPDVHPDSDWVNRQSGKARCEFFLTVERWVPSFFTKLRDDVLPEFSRLTASRPGYFEDDWYYRTWKVESDYNDQFEPLLLDWAKSFHVDREEWILIGALRSLNLWRKDAQLANKAEPSAFRPTEVSQELISDQESRFDFHDHWDLEMERWTDFKKKHWSKFAKHTHDFEKKLRELAEKRGGQRVRYRYSPDSFKWFVWSQLAGHSIEEIERSNERELDESAIQKGIQTVAKLLDWHQLRKGWSVVGKKIGKSPTH